MDPLTIAGLISAGGGILGGSFGNDDDVPNYTKEDFLKSGYKEFDPTKAKGDLARLINSKIKDRRNVSTSRSMRQGVSDPGAVFSNESDLHQAEILGRSKIDETDRAEENSIAQMLFELNVNADAQNRNQPSFLVNAFTGALHGANLGLNVADFIQKGDLGDEIIEQGKPTSENKVQPNKPRTPKAPINTISNPEFNYDFLNNINLSKNAGDNTGSNLLDALTGREEAEMRKEKNKKTIIQTTTK